MSKQRASSLSRMPVEDGLRYGPWSLWRVDGDELLIIHADGARAARLYVSSNGWFDFRIAPGNWRTAWSNGTFGHDSGRFEEEVNERIGREPASDWPTGLYAAGQWRFVVSAVGVTVSHPRNDFRLVLYRDRPLWTWGKKPPEVRQGVAEDEA